MVDIAPAVGSISPEFREYLAAMKEIEGAAVKSRKEADAILEKYEKASSAPRLLNTQWKPGKALADGVGAPGLGRILECGSSC